jgi:hypothetical protein
MFYYWTYTSNTIQMQCPTPIALPLRLLQYGYILYIILDSSVFFLPEQGRTSNGAILETAVMTFAPSPTVPDPRIPRCHGGGSTQSIWWRVFFVHRSRIWIHERISVHRGCTMTLIVCKSFLCYPCGHVPVLLGIRTKFRYISAYWHMKWFQIVVVVERPFVLWFSLMKTRCNCTDNKKNLQGWSSKLTVSQWGSLLWWFESFGRHLQLASH